MDSETSERALSHWSVWRQDDNGNRFRVQAGLTEQQARDLVRHFEELGHKQCYWAEAPDAGGARCR